ncbi:MAG: cytochrome c biogenesis protein CcsA [Deltaproteobacteria bacterium]|nr:cytochrome c biogenesis protein CcsA [Deltaproteobacteria bacterium]
MIDTENLLWFLNFLVPVLYLVTVLAYLALFFTEHRFAKRVARPMLVASVLVNLVYFAAFTSYFEHVPLVSGPQVVGGVGFALAVTYLWVENQTQTPHTGPFILFLSFLCQAVSTLNPRLDPYVPKILDSVLFSFHVSAAVLGYSSLALASVYGLIYLLLYKDMRIKHFGLVFHRLPPLAVLDRMNFIATAVGFAFITVAMALGFVWSCLVFKGPVADPKLIVGVVTWLAYGMTVYGRRRHSWQGPRLAYSSLFGFVVLLLSMFVVNFFFTKFHVFT